ncbi:hypothetical protein [Anaeromicropila herbilytica]|uniref:Uncharacterized protein n=1 Tax=Anaeromicropila herbilytica TaxID=2785025 RepID=A0A7R7IDV7_9FIRM|nr:hypothetical protein [Anaeromicropila herbilytica]BCN31474.1 hypothetical protein bsdtb5_27690 [Anaeromicropila herbilytica]
MDPLMPINPMFPNFSIYPAATPKLIGTDNEKEEFLASLDSDKRDYVLKHTSLDCSVKDLEECMKDLKGE